MVVHWQSSGTGLELDLLSCYPLGNQVTLVVVQWLSGCTLAVKSHWIGTRLVEWLAIGNQVT